MRVRNVLKNQKDQQEEPKGMRLNICPEGILYFLLSTIGFGLWSLLVVNVDSGRRMVKHVYRVGK